MIKALPGHRILNTTTFAPPYVLGIGKPAPAAEICLLRHDAGEIAREAVEVDYLADLERLAQLDLTILFGFT